MIPFTPADAVLAANVLPAAFNTILVLTALCSPMVCVVSETMAAARKKVFYKKYAQQQAQAGLLFGIYMVLVACGAAGFVATKSPSTLELIKTYPLLFAPIAIALAPWLIFHAIYSATWMKMKQQKALHITTGLLTALFALAALVVFSGSTNLLFGEIHHQEYTPLDIVRLYLPIMPVRPSALWLVIPQLVLFGIVATTATGFLYMLYRRNKDDWGRDYYNFAFKHCAGWNLTGWVLTFAAHGFYAYTLWKGMPPKVMEPQVLYPWCGAMAFALVAFISTIFVYRSATPLRMKPAIALNNISTLIALGAVFFCVLKLFFV